jgi:hypothetical protein
MKRLAGQWVSSSEKQKAALVWAASVEIRWELKSGDSPGIGGKQNDGHDNQGGENVELVAGVGHFREGVLLIPLQRPSSMLL